MKTRKTFVALIGLSLAVVIGSSFSPGGEARKPDGYPKQNIGWIVCAGAGAAIDIPTRALVDAIGVTEA